MHLFVYGDGVSYSASTITVADKVLIAAGGLSVFQYDTLRKIYLRYDVHREVWVAVEQRASSAEQPGEVGEANE